MEEIIKKELCTGCTACMNVCPKEAISFIEDKDGFKYPVIDNDKCINCGLCKNTCPVLNTRLNESLNHCYVGYSNEKEDRYNSSSGGIFSLLAKYILDNNGIVVGAAFDENNKLNHVAIEKKEELESLKKSKYLQSDLNNIFMYIKKQLDKKKILFVGTPCQVAGIKSFIKNNDNLITVDLFCHGVPSPKIFTKYIMELEEKNQDKLINYDFRDNSTGWDTYSNKAIFKNKEITTDRTKNDYMNLFLSDICLRESCYDCNFKLGNKYSDITLGDFWGVKNYYPEMYNSEGVSAVIVNTEKGEELFGIIKDKLNYRNCSLDNIISGNKSLILSSKKPLRRSLFFKEIDNKSIYYLTKKYTNKSILKRIKNKMKILVKER